MFLHKPGTLQIQQMKQLFLQDAEVLKQEILENMYVYSKYKI